MASVYRDNMREVSSRVAMIVAQLNTTAKASESACLCTESVSSWQMSLTCTIRHSLQLDTCLGAHALQIVVHAVNEEVSFKKEQLQAEAGVNLSLEQQIGNRLPHESNKT